MNNEARHDLAKQIATLTAKIRKLDTDKDTLAGALMRALTRLSEPYEQYDDGLVAQVVVPRRLVRDEKAFAALAKSLGFKTPLQFDKRLLDCHKRVDGTAYLKVTP